MGTINYKTSDYITLGYNCGDIDYSDELYIIYEFDEITAAAKEMRAAVKNTPTYYLLKLAGGY